MKLNVKEMLHRLSELLELLVGFFMLAALAACLIGLVCRISLPALVADPGIFQSYLSIAATIVIGIEFVEMLCQHTLDSVVEVIMLAIARQMIVEHSAPLENLIAVISVCLLFVVRKFLFVPRLDKVSHPPLSAMFAFLARKNRSEVREKAGMIFDQLADDGFGRGKSNEEES